MQWQTGESGIQGVTLGAMSPTQSRARTIKPPEQRRQEILDAAARLFHEKGFEETTVQDVARAAGVASGTVYLYFSSKEKILTELENEFMLGMQERMTEIIGEVARRRSAGEPVPYSVTSDTIIEALFAHSLEHPDVCHVLFKYAPRGEAAMDPARPQRMMEAAMAEVFRSATQHGVIHTSDPEMAAYLLNSVACLAAQEAIALGEPEKVQRVVEALKELFRKTLAPLDTV